MNNIDHIYDYKRSDSIRRCAILKPPIWLGNIMKPTDRKCCYCCSAIYYRQSAHRCLYLLGCVNPIHGLLKRLIEFVICVFVSFKFIIRL